MDNLPIKIRGLSHPEIPLFDSAGVVTNQEKAFIASSWSHKERANPAYFWVSKRAYHHQFYLGVICMLIDARPELFHVAHNTDAPDQILGWVCADNRADDDATPSNYYQFYVKDDFREYGLDSMLTLRFQKSNSREFMELINDSRKTANQANRIPNQSKHIRQDIQATT